MLDMTLKEVNRLYDWLTENGFTPEEAMQCVKYIETGEKNSLLLTDKKEAD